MVRFTQYWKAVRGRKLGLESTRRDIAVKGGIVTQERLLRPTQKPKF